MNKHENCSVCSRRRVNRAQYLLVVSCEEPDKTKLNEKRSPLPIPAHQRHSEQPSKRRLEKDECRAEHDATVPFGAPAETDGPGDHDGECRGFDPRQRQEEARREERRHHVHTNCLVPHRTAEDRDRRDDSRRDPADGAVDPKFTAMDELVLNDEQSEPGDHHGGMRMNDRRHGAEVHKAAQRELHEACDDEQCNEECVTREKGLIGHVSASRRPRGVHRSSHVEETPRFNRPLSERGNHCTCDQSRRGSFYRRLRSGEFGNNDRYLPKPAMFGQDWTGIAARSGCRPVPPALRLVVVLVRPVSLLPSAGVVRSTRAVRIVPMTGLVRCGMAMIP